MEEKISSDVSDSSLNEQTYEVQINSSDKLSEQILEFKNEELTQRFGIVAAITQTQVTVDGSLFPGLVYQGVLKSSTGVFGIIIDIFGSPNRPFYICHFESSLQLKEEINIIQKSIQESEIEIQ